MGLEWHHSSLCAWLAADLIYYSHRGDAQLSTRSGDRPFQGLRVETVPIMKRRYHLPFSLLSHERSWEFSRSYVTCVDIVTVTNNEVCAGVFSCF